MTDDLVKRLRADQGYRDPGITDEAADRIKALTAENEKLRAALEWAADHEPWLVEKIYERAALGDTQ